VTRPQASEVTLYGLMLLYCDFEEKSCLKSRCSVFQCRL